MRLSRMSMKHCPEIAELYITPRNLGFYECNGVDKYTGCRSMTIRKAAGCNPLSQDDIIECAVKPRPSGLGI
jgi:hypothetical protein